jgi:hypothetical protein
MAAKKDTVPYSKPVGGLISDQPKHGTTEIPIVIEPIQQRTKWKRFFDFIEQPLFLVVVSILGGIVGVVLYTPILLVCDVCILLALHRSRSVADLKRSVQFGIYGALFIVCTGILFWMGNLLQNRARIFIQQIATAVVESINKSSPSNASVARPQETATSKAIPNPQTASPPPSEKVQPPHGPSASEIADELAKRMQSQKSPKAVLRSSLNRLTDQESAISLGKRLGPGQSFYRLEMIESKRDISGVVINLDLPGLLVDQPLIVHTEGAENLTAKAEVLPPTLNINGEPESISKFNNSATIEIPQFRQHGFVGIGLVTAPVKPEMLTVMTISNGALVIGIAPAFDRYGSLSIRYREGGNDSKYEFHSFAIRRPDPEVELIDSAKELYPGSRSILLGITRQDALRHNGLLLKIHAYMDELK